MQAALDDAALLQQRADAHEVDAPRAQQLRLLLLREAQRQLRACRLLSQAGREHVPALQGRSMPHREDQKVGHARASTRQGASSMHG